MAINNNKIIFRKAIYNDKDQIAKVLIDFYNMNDLDEGIKAFTEELKKDFYYIVAIQNGEIIGLVSWLIHGLPKHGLFELDRICVLSKTRGMGIGKKLVEALINDASKWYEKMNAKVRKLYLLTHENNTNAHAFYERVGFTHEATLKDHYYKKQDERVYSMFLL